MNVELDVWFWVWSFVLLAVAILVLIVADSRIQKSLGLGFLAIPILAAIYRIVRVEEYLEKFAVDLSSVSFIKASALIDSWMIFIPICVFSWFLRFSILRRKHR